MFKLHLRQSTCEGVTLSVFNLQSQTPGTLVTTMEVDIENTVLISADYLGFVYLWNIDGYCLDGAESRSPECRFPLKGVSKTN